MSHGKWKEAKQQSSKFPGPAVPGCCLVSFHFLWTIHPICRPVVILRFYIFTCGFQDAGLGTVRLGKRWTFFEQNQFDRLQMVQFECPVSHSLLGSYTYLLQISAPAASFLPLSIVQYRDGQNSLSPRGWITQPKTHFFGHLCRKNWVIIGGWAR